MDEQKHGIKETKEILDFAITMVSELAKHNHDGKIDMGEWLMMSMKLAPMGVKAFMGVDQLQSELKELSEEEMKELVVKGVLLAESILKLATPK